MHMLALASPQTRRCNLLPLAQLHILITDRVSEEGNAIGSVRPFVCPLFHGLCFEPNYLLILIFCLCADDDYSFRGVKVEVNGYG